MSRYRKGTIMKKIQTFLIVMMLISNAQPASALMIDPGQISAKISDILQRITDAKAKVSQQTNQIKLMTTQGFNFSELIDINGFLSDLQGSLINMVIEQQINQVIAGTKEKNRRVVAAQKEAYGAAAQAQYANKLAYTDDNISQTSAKHAEYQNLAIQKCQEKEQAQIAYEAEKDEAEKNKKFEKYTILVAECEDYQARERETSALVAQLKAERNALQAEANIIGTDEDKEYHELQMREDALSEQEEKTDFYGVESGGDDEWDSEGFADKFQLSGDKYKEFLERYFYNPEKIAGGSDSESRLAFQSTMDKIMRERRYLLVNSAAHLMQVSATVRHEIPVRTASIEKVFKNAPEASGELEAMLSYAATRVENARALLLYAKLLSAKIQYMAASDLLGIEPKKVWKDEDDYTEFDLNRYILTEEYVKDLANEYNKTIDFTEEN